MKRLHRESREEVASFCSSVEQWMAAKSNQWRLQQPISVRVEAEVRELKDNRKEVNSNNNLNPSIFEMTIYSRHNRPEYFGINLQFDVNDFLRRLKVEFPTFDESNPEGWVRRHGQYFEYGYSGLVFARGNR